MNELNECYENITYEQAKNILRENMDTLKMSFIAAGYYLKYIRDHELYLEDGYQSIWEFAEDNYGIRKSTASRWMSMNDRFSQGGNSPVLAEEFRGFEKSQLQEMLYLDDKQIQAVTPDMTVKEIREVRKPEEQKKEEQELEKPDEMARQYLKNAAKHLIACWHDWFLQDFASRVMQVDRSPKEIKKKIEGKSRSYIFHTDKGTGHINLSDDSVQVWNERGEYIGDFDWFYLAAAIQSMWNIVEMENAQKSQEEVVATSQQEEPSETIPETEPESGIVDEETVEVVDAAEEEPAEELYEETSDQSDIDLLKKELDKAQRNLDLMLSCYAGKDIRVRKQKLLVGALAGMLCDLDVVDIPEIQQPDLPRFRNNDQRKEWLRKYEAWGLWYEDKNIGARYYKYDFENGARLIAEEYISPSTEWYGEHVISFLHLVGGPEPPRNKCVPKWQRHDRYDRYPNSETELVEFLKYIQRKES